MLYREKIAVCSHIHTKHIHIPCVQNVELLNIKPGGTYSYHWTLKGKYLRLNTNLVICLPAFLHFCYQHWSEFPHIYFTQTFCLAPPHQGYLFRVKRCNSVSDCQTLSMKLLRSFESRAHWQPYIKVYPNPQHYMLLVTIIWQDSKLPLHASHVALPT